MIFTLEQSFTLEQPSSSRFLALTYFPKKSQGGLTLLHSNAFQIQCNVVSIMKKHIQNIASYLHLYTMYMLLHGTKTKNT